MLIKKKMPPFFLLGLLFLFQCTGEAVLSNLAHQRIRLVLKGTYESTSPKGWQGSLYQNEEIPILSLSPPSLGGDQVKWYIDIAQIRIARGSGFTGGDPEDYWEFFAPYRRLFCSSYTDRYGKDIKTCREQEGQKALEEFFSTGYIYPAVDIKGGFYNHVGIYFRKIITSPGYNYSGNSLQDPVVASFDNRRVEGVELTTYYGSTPDGSDSSYLFPLERTDLSLEVPSSPQEYTLEIRIFFKNLLTWHAEEINKILYIGFSDWKSAHIHNGTLSQGGGILFSARVYEESKEATLMISSPPSSGDYITLHPGILDPKKEIPLIAAPISSLEIPHIQPGTYQLYITCDKKKLETSGEVNGTDGFPETASLCINSLSFSEKEIKSVDLSSCSCP